MPEIRDCIFCEFVRSEMGGKVSALGIFGDQLRLLGPEAPYVLSSFGALVYIADREQRGYALKFSIQMPGEETPIEHGYNVVGEPGKVGHNVAFTSLGLEFKNAGTLMVTVELGTEPPIRRAFALEVVFGPYQPIVGPPSAVPPSP